MQRIPLYTTILELEKFQCNYDLAILFEGLKAFQSNQQTVSNCGVQKCLLKIPQEDVNHR